MHTFVEFLVELKALAAGDAADKLARIAELFANPRAPAEFQVGRHMVARLLGPEVDRQLDSIDPAQRKIAIACARRVLTREAAFRALRRVYFDPDPSVRGAARRAAWALGRTIPITEVRKRAADDRRGGEFHTMWAFGIFASERARTRRPKQPGRAALLDGAGLPQLASRDDVARLVGVDDLAPLMRPGTGPGSGYIEFEVPKARGGTRRIAAPRAELRRVQRAILDRILAHVPLHDACHGFVAGRSTVTNARPHRGAALVLKLDLKDFFPTVHFRRVAGVFRSLGYGAEVAGTLAALTTYRPRLPGGDVVWPGMLPQGAPTSPALANLACRRLDRRLALLAAKVGAVYTRYADDLTFSFATRPELRIGRFLWWVDAICEQEGFLERADKRRILRANQQQRVTGLVVNAGVNVPRADRRRFRAILHNCAAHGIASQARERDDFTAYLAGYAAYVHMVDPVLGRAWIDEVERLLAPEGDV
jgi:RNA-directed DNA polymerase